MLEPGYMAAEQEAEKKLQEWGITSLPVDPIEIADRLDILVHPKPDTAEGVSGMLVRHGNNFGILYATHIDNEGFQRFSVAHELGHFLLEGHIDHIFPNGEGEHVSRAGFVSHDPYELEADLFAAGLLMPNPMFSEALKRTEPGLEAIEELSSLCVTSLNATAIRYAKCADHPVAIIVSTDLHIDYCVMSDPFKSIKGLEWLRKRQPLPRASHTYQFNQDRKRVAHAERDEGVSSLPSWFGGGTRLDLVEEVWGLGSYGKTLTVLRPIISPEADEDEEEQEFERNLIESWTPRFRK